MDALNHKRVFVGYGYNERDRWIETHVFPLIEALGCDIAHGKAVYGGTLPVEILQLIRGSDAMVGFTTRREQVGPGQFTTHPWVVQELVACAAQVVPLPYVEVREIGVLSPGGVLDAYNAQRIHYDESDRSTCLLQVAQAVAQFRDRLGVTTIRLGPSQVLGRINEHRTHHGFHCHWETLRGIDILPSLAVPVLPIKGSLFVKLRGIAEGDLVRVRMACQACGWSLQSDFESVDAVDLLLKG